MKQEQWIPRIHVLGSSPQARLALAVTEIKRGNYQQALDECQAAVHTNPLHADAHLTLAWMYAALGRYEESVAASRSALNCNPKLEQAHLTMAHSQKMLGNIQEALAECRPTPKTITATSSWAN